MKLTPIPLSSAPVTHPRNPYIAERSDISCGANFLHWIARRSTQQEVADAHDAEAERYASGWVLAEAA